MRLLSYLLPALAVLAPLWRRRHLRSELSLARRRLAGESVLRAGAERGLADANTRLRRLVAERDDVLENERRRIARDIHDDLGQNLLALKIDLSILQSHSAALPAKAKEQLALIAGNLDLTIKSLRCTINDLRPVALQGGLRKAIECQLREFSRMNGIPHVFDAGRDEPDAFDAREDGAGPLDTVVFRILQEALANIARHARAATVRVALAREPGALRLTVRDDGVGLPPGARRRGCGLRGIEERVRAVGGQFHLDSEPGRGTTLALAIPRAPALAAAAHPACPAAGLGLRH